MAGNVGLLEDGGRASKRGDYRYRVWFLLDNVKYEELKSELELEDAGANKHRKMMDFVLRMRQTKRWAAMRQWHAAMLTWREEARERDMALRIQTVFRMFRGRVAALVVRKTRLQAARLRRQKAREDALALREHEREQWELQYAREAGYSLDGVRFFKTSAALRAWADKTTQFITQWEMLLHRDDREKRLRALRRWRTNTIKLRLAEANRSVLPHATWQEACALAIAKPLPQVVAGAFSPSHWHPALGLRLPPLPMLTGTEAKLSGEVKVTDVKRFQHFKTVLAGPVDCGNWLLPPRVLIGGFPWGQVG